MEWNDWIGKEVFIRTVSKKFYSGTVESIDDSSQNIFLYLTDKFGRMVVLAHSEIAEIKEEEGK